MAPRIACIFAHPDDETFCVGGIIAKYAAAGADIHLYCATYGDAGRAASVPVSSREELAAIRREELDAAARILGICSVEMGRYRDGELDQAKMSELVADLVSFIRHTRPHIVIGFGPEGAPTGHRDHRALSYATTAAFFLSQLATAHPEQQLEPFRARRLFYHAWAYPMPDPRLELESVPATALIDVREWKDKKAAAFEAHTTQRGSSHAFYSSALVDVERLAFAAGDPQPSPIIDDIFAGLAGID
ncbi:MAG TPA: PIG-L deacetylase family protein [Gemmatimonadaceae bacterium]|nr:PIG-L deacetylase family protein [Gemmatimonadaceae bacterium]